MNPYLHHASCLFSASGAVLETGLDIDVINGILINEPMLEDGPGFNELKPKAEVSKRRNGGD